MTTVERSQEWSSYTGLTLTVVQKRIKESKEVWILMSCKSEKGIIIQVQKQSFFEECDKLAKGNTLLNSSKILVLKP